MLKKIPVHKMYQKKRGKGERDNRAGGYLFCMGQAPF